MDGIMARALAPVRRTWVHYRVPAGLRRTIDRVKQSNLTYLSQRKLETLAYLCLRNERNHVRGAIVETGCALGGSAIVMASAKRQDRPLRIYDVFGMIPPPSDADGEDVHERYSDIRAGKSTGIGGATYYGYVDNLREKVAGSLRSFGKDPSAHGITLIEGLIQDTLTVDGPVSLAHIDVDWYEPVRTSLERIEPNLAEGGALVIDDYLDWSGCRKAVEEYFGGARARRYRMDLSAGSLVITRTGR